MVEEPFGSTIDHVLTIFKQKREELQRDILIKYGVRHLKCNQRLQADSLEERSKSEAQTRKEKKTLETEALAVPTVLLMQLAEQMPLQPTAFVQEMKKYIYMICNVTSKARAHHKRDLLNVTMVSVKQQLKE